MIRLEHLNLVVRDIPASLNFYKAAFPHWEIRGGGESEWYGRPRNWVHFGDDYQYLALNDNGIDENRDLKGYKIGLAHFAFVTDDIKSVIDRIAKAGFEISNDGAKDEFRQNVYFVDPDGYEVEFVQYFTDQPELRNQY